MPRHPSPSKLSLMGGAAAHGRLLVSAAAGVVAAFFWPGVDAWASQLLVGWNVFAWLYLVWVAITLVRADSGHIKRLALKQAESAAIVLAIVVLASVTSVVAVVFELRAAKAAGPHHMAPHLAFAFITVLGSWLLLPTVFALTYAASYYRREPDCGLQFPNAQKTFEPDHTDFLYFAYTIAVTAQTSDVAVTTREMRRLVIAQSVLSFVFNTMILAFSINAAASFF